MHTETSFILHDRQRVNVERAFWGKNERKRSVEQAYTKETHRKLDEDQMNEFGG